MVARKPGIPHFCLVRIPSACTLLWARSSANLHSLFDRASDTAISFSGQTRCSATIRDQDLLDVTMPVPGNTLIRLIPDYFTKTLGRPLYVPFDDSYFSVPPMVWASWTSYYDEVRKQDIVQNADWIAANLKPYGFNYVLLDDGYDRGKERESTSGLRSGTTINSPMGRSGWRSTSSPKACTPAYGSSPTLMREP